MAMGHLQAAKESFVAARQLDPGNESASVGLAHLYLTLADSVADEAERQQLNRLAARAAQEGTRSAGHSYRLWLVLGSALARLPGREVESQLAYDRAVELSASPWKALVNRAVIRLRLEDAAGARGDYEQVCGLLRGVAPAARDATMWVVLIDSTRARRELGTSLSRPDEVNRAQAELLALGSQLEGGALPPTQLEQLRTYLRQAQR
jgi:Tfp pilus assembly protein PilF